MKKALVVSAILLTSLAGMAKVVKTVVVTTQPQMHCENCEKKIKGNLRFEKGVKQIECNIDEQRITITYDGDKTDSLSIIKSFEKFGYQATEVKKEEPAKKEEETTKKN
ncbi:MAG: heavy-metal-associated domain-containing protein [Muribaculaceae bacterium]|nr:heavy-metal-associated domain-containing protein [Muribaculaceae bacterium]